MVSIQLQPWRGKKKHKNNTLGVITDNFTQTYFTLQVDKRKPDLLNTCNGNSSPAPLKALNPKNCTQKLRHGTLVSIQPGRTLPTPTFPPTKSGSTDKFCTG